MKHHSVLISNTHKGTLRSPFLWALHPPLQWSGKGSQWRSAGSHHTLTLDNLQAAIEKANSHKNQEKVSITIRMSDVSEKLKKVQYTCLVSNIYTASELYILKITDKESGKYLG